MSSLGPPPPSDHLRRFPSYDLQPTFALARIHSIHHAPWHFSSGMTGRFDLSGPNGTCYLAETLTGAFVEVFQRWIAQRIPVPRSEIENRQGSRLLAPHRFNLADCTSSRALEFGVTGEMHGTSDRELTQAWAAAFHAAGFGGVRYLVSTAPSMRLAGIALFHQQGEAVWPAASTGPIPSSLLDEIEREFGVLVR